MSEHIGGSDGQYVKSATRSWSSVDIRARSATDAAIRVTTSLAVAAAEATDSMFAAMSPEPAAACVTDREISLVVADCSSIAPAMVLWCSLIDWMIAEISLIASTADVV